MGTDFVFCDLASLQKEELVKECFLLQSIADLTLRGWRL
jgi:hypothetical protein